MVQLYKLQGLFPNILQVGFSAYKDSMGVTDDTMLSNWSNSYPEFSGNYFNASSGIYTVPRSGVYAAQATISYATNSAISTQLGAGITPSFVIKKTTPTTESLVVGEFPIFNTSLLILSLRTILANSTITLTDVVQLTQGDTLGLFYSSDGLALPLTLRTVQWSVFPLFSIG